MSMLSPTPYRDTLTQSQQALYRAITAGILEKKAEINVRCSNALQSNFSHILQCIHHDHPELFWINWWSGIRFVHIPAFQRTKVYFSNLLEPEMITACNNTLSNKIKTLSARFPQSSPCDAQYRFILKECVKGISYRDTGSALWDHTVIGPLLSHTAVCEGISKLFLLYCQYFNLPCIAISGSYSSAPHAWNAVIINHVLYHVDVTATMQQGILFNPFLTPFKTPDQLTRYGYRWNNCVLNNSSRR